VKKAIMHFSEWRLSEDFWQKVEGVFDYQLKQINPFQITVQTISASVKVPRWYAVKECDATILNRIKSARLKKITPNK